MPEERALGAAIIAVVIGIVGFFILIAGILGLVAWGFNQNWGSFNTTNFLSWLKLPEFAAAAIVIIVGLIYLGIAIGLYRQHFWALVVMFIVGLFYIIGQLSGVVYSLYYASPTSSITDTNVLGSIIGIVVVAIVLAYLAAVRDDFI